MQRSPYSPGKCFEVQTIVAWNVTWLQIQCIYSISICCLLACHCWLLRDFVVQVRNAEEHDRQQERLLTATQQSCDQLRQQVQDQNQQLQVQRQHATEVSPSSSFTCQTVYQHHVACAILWMQGRSMTAHCVADAELKKPIHLVIGMLACISTFALNLAMLLCSVLLYA